MKTELTSVADTEVDSQSYGDDEDDDDSDNNEDDPHEPATVRTL